ncbi:hypothetical protein LNI94_11985 [Tenacibaculum finnmarkense genomovar ulcerans]|uniref:hypothetical protein n=1 Tax=Tenacibaculum finnmarkense TaxID=2781243 RepID=UPI001E492B33|nr:hypothetical protein [Tenacibaculum finnmarkense]MCD8423604.1 hypothetical protein [Tenacibaculum finnmarkense genomovar ulcerans]
MTEKITIDYKKILLEDSLFSNYSLENINEMDLLNLLYFIGRQDNYNNLKTIDSYCSICKKNTTFNSEDSNSQELDGLLKDSGMHNGHYSVNNKEITLIEELEKKCVFVRKFNCPRKPNDSSHSQIFLFRIIGTKLIKIGQHPTLADLNKEDLNKYRKLNSVIYSELNKAVGLAAHGVGIGSFVYLRRIIEKHIVYPKINQLIIEKKLTKEQVAESDFKGKINLAKDSLPKFLVENRKIYSILSKGIHELEEEECKEYFPILRTAIEIILDEQIEKKEKEKKNKLISEQINKIK